MAEAPPYPLNIGPIHPALKEPTQFKFVIDGEHIRETDFQPGFNHRGVEYLGMKRNPLQVLHLAERVCGICSAAHQYVFCRAVEHAADIVPTERGDYLRAIVAELERIHSHLLWAGVAGHELGFDSILHYTWKVREDVQDILEILCGNRVNYAYYIFGGVRRDISKEDIAKCRKILSNYRKIEDTVLSIFFSDPTIIHRTKDVGVLTHENAVKLCACGPLTRGAGVKKDIRFDWPHGAYGDMMDDFKVVTPETMGYHATGDVFSQIVVRIGELFESVRMTEWLLDNMPSGPITSEPNLSALLMAKLRMAEGEGVARVEAPRGEDIHYVRLKKNKMEIDSWKIRVPTYGNIMSWLTMFKDQQIADIPIIIASIDPCIGCMDRVTLVRDGSQAEVDWKVLHDMSIEKSRRLMR
ncbi:MAG: nickel-dependent hydrogenase large subunit [Candidatus Thermoplasmatota archaeon]|nr:nickel-dependent hydrogenase large subunit [Candidatus Thermoplasmatota archaeon]